MAGTLNFDSDSAAQLRNGAAVYSQLQQVVLYHSANDIAPEAQKQLLIRSVATNSAGMGAVVGQLRSSLAPATMLDVDFTTFPLVSEHEYHAASVLGINRIQRSLAADTTLCAVSTTLPPQQVMELVDSWCFTTRTNSTHALERYVPAQWAERPQGRGPILWIKHAESLEIVGLGSVPDCKLPHLP